jgi:hypothetical protein
MINVTGTTEFCSDMKTTLTASASPEIANPVYKWYSSQTAETPFCTDESYTTSVLTATNTYYVSVSGTGICENAPGSRKKVKVTIHSIAQINYPDLRISVCRDAGTSINLSKYIDSLNVTSIQWTSPTGIPITADGIISTDNLPHIGVYPFTYTVNHICKSDIKSKVYLEILQNRMARQIKDTVVVCYLHSEAVNINRLFGIEASGEWDYPPEADNYIKQSTSSLYDGALVMDGKSFYESGPHSTYHGVAAKTVKFTYKTDNNSCLHGKEYDMVIVLTENILN